MAVDPDAGCTLGDAAVLAASAGSAVERLRLAGFEAVRSKYLGPAPDLVPELIGTPVMTGNFAAFRPGGEDAWRYVPLAKL